MDELLPTFVAFILEIKVPFYLAYGTNDLTSDILSWLRSYK
jgi:hypothetical protein